MPKTFPIWATAIAVTFLLSSTVLCPPPTMAGPARGADQVQTGTHFLVRLDQEMNTGKDKLNQKFEARTIEPLATSRGHVVAPGAKIFGHISRIEPAGMAGRARLWLTFDDIDTGRDTLPLVAEVSSVPGEYSVRQGESKEGEIQGYTAKGAQVAEATAVGAVKGSAGGVASHNAKAAAMGAAADGFAAFLASSGLGHELDLPKGTKLELVLNRPLYLTQ